MTDSHDLFAPLSTSTSSDSTQIDVNKPTDSDDGNGNVLEKQTTDTSRPCTLEQCQQSIATRIRTREKTGHQRFSHSLSHVRTTETAIVDFDGPDDPYRPMNWGFKKKAMTTILYALTVMGVNMASSIYSTGERRLVGDFEVEAEIGTIGTCLLLFGLAIDPLFWGPLSEVYGRKAAALPPYFLAAVLSFGTATAKDLQTVMITRFFTGFFGSAPVSNTGGVISDIWMAQQRGGAMVAYGMAVLGGPIMGPVIGGAIAQGQLSWRWTEYVMGIVMMVLLLLDVTLLDESYPPVLLVYKARRLRFETGNWALHARHEEWDVSVYELANKYLVRPFQLLATPICFLVALYAAFVYGILFLCLAAFPVEFQEIRGWNELVGNLPFLAIFVGIAIAAPINLGNQKFYLEQFKANNNRPVPEARLRPMMFGSIFFAAGLFIFGWTSAGRSHWTAPVVGAVVMGLGFFTISQSSLNYLVDTFNVYSASAMAANTFLRYVFAGAFPLFANIMFHRLSVAWASSILGFVSVALIPIPFLFYMYGRRIRASGKWSKASV